MAGLVGAGKAVITAYPDFSKTFSTVSSLTLNTQLHKSLSDSEDLQVEAEKCCDNTVNNAASIKDPCISTVTNPPVSAFPLIILSTSFPLVVNQKKKKKHKKFWQLKITNIFTTSKH